MANRILKKPVALRDLIDENGHAVIPEGTAEIIEMAFESCSCEPLMKERFPVESPDDWINGLF